MKKLVLLTLSLSTALTANAFADSFDPMAETIICAQKEDRKIPDSKRAKMDPKNAYRAILIERISGKNRPLPAGDSRSVMVNGTLEDSFSKTQTIAITEHELRIEFDTAGRYESPSDPALKAVIVIDLAAGTATKWEARTDETVSFENCTSSSDADFSPGAWLQETLQIKVTDYSSNASQG